MDPNALSQLLDQVRRGETSVDAARRQIAAVLPQVDVRPPSATAPMPAGGGLGGGEGAIAHLDHHRALRCGFPEVVLGSSKTVDELVAIAGEILAHAETLLVTRVDAPRAAALRHAIPEAVHHERARAVTVLRGERPTPRPGVVVVTAGTGDIPVAEEARVTAEAMGEEILARYDVGVAGLHRVLGEVDRLREANVIVVAAGMDGALPSVVGGLVAVPVIAVPTSVGYGMALEGVAPLLTMLNACAPNISVVNVDNGFGAGYLASLINRRIPCAP